MADKSKGRNKDGNDTIRLDGAEGDELVLADIAADRPRAAAPKIIQNYYFKDDLGAGDIAFASSEPVGPAGDQCYRFEIVNNAIDLTSNASITTKPGNCVFLSSAVIEKENGKPGKATFIICCEKETDGKCKDCATVVTLTVTTGGRNVTKQVKVFCRAN
ncbi:MAG: hypothetical protein RH942_00445 [Kiloniellaceae bacterium]